MTALLLGIAVLVLLACGVGTLVPTAGKAFIAGKLSGDDADTPNRIAWGTGTTDPVAGNTALETEASEARATATLSRVTTTTTNDTFQAVGTLTADGTKTISEAGLFDAASGGDMIVRATFAGIPLVSGDQIQITWKIQLT